MEVLMKNKTWGGRFKQPLHPLAEAFNASLAFDHALYSYDILGSKAHANMLARQGLITQNEAELLCQTLDEIGLEIQEGKQTWNNHHEDIHMYIEYLLIQKIGETGKKLHTGRSRNDQVVLDLRLYTRDATQQMMAKLHEVITVFSELAKQHAQDKMPGYTHLQQAQPIFLGHYFDAYQHMFQRDRSRFQDLLERMNLSPLGAGALAGSSLPLDREFVAKALGFRGFITNTLDAVSDRDFIIEFCAAACTTMVHLSRLSEDFILWATSEFNFLMLSDEFATGSSLMPNKKNPDILELIRGKSGRVFGNLMAMLTVMKGLPLTYNKDMQEDKEALFDTVNTLTACLTILPPFMRSLQFNIQHMAEQVDHGYMDATSLLENLVMQGIPFREAHHQVGAWVLEALETGCSLNEVVNKGNHDGLSSIS
jgi:argininosuccinate lyase